ncbi:MAG TPA: hypothetical protein VNT30_07975 [Stellaceae bacterium]|nr:hypothetical protein [Stellaceae bacterium]
MQDHATIQHQPKTGRRAGGISRLLLAAALGVVTLAATLPARADDGDRYDHERYRQEREWNHHGWQRRDDHPPPTYYSPAPRYVYAPPPVIYGPPPPPPGINFIFPLHIH